MHIITDYHRILLSYHFGECRSKEAASIWKQQRSVRRHRTSSQVKEHLECPRPAWLSLSEDAYKTKHVSQLLYKLCGIKRHSLRSKKLIQEKYVQDSMSDMSCKLLVQVDMHKFLCLSGSGRLPSINLQYRHSTSAPSANGSFQFPVPTSGIVFHHMWHLHYRMSYPDMIIWLTPCFILLWTWHQFLVLRPH